MSNEKDFIYGYIRFYLNIKVLTGLRVGGRKETVEIGAIDNPVIRGVDRFPYIPGSSLKGKLRSLIEKFTGKFNMGRGEPYGVSDDCENLARLPDHFIVRMFGNHKGSKGLEPRIIVRDFIVDKDITKNNLKIEEEAELLEKVCEIKEENIINRIEGKAENPREMERVVPGVVFKGEIIYKLLGWSILSEQEVINQTKDELEKLKRALIYLMKYDYLGGSGTRGYGKVAIYINKIELKTKNDIIVIEKCNGISANKEDNAHLKDLIDNLKLFLQEINSIAQQEESNYK